MVRKQQYKCVECGERTTEQLGVFVYTGVYGVVRKQQHNCLGFDEVAASPSKLIIITMGYITVRTEAI